MGWLANFMLMLSQARVAVDPLRGGSGSSSQAESSLIAKVHSKVSGKPDRFVGRFYN